jgi:hypothetical protein
MTTCFFLYSSITGLANSAALISYFSLWSGLKILTGASFGFGFGGDTGTDSSLSTYSSGGHRSLRS